jgi:hypothetical protein
MLAHGTRVEALPIGKTLYDVTCEQCLPNTVEWLADQALVVCSSKWHVLDTGVSPLPSFLRVGQVALQVGWMNNAIGMTASGRLEGFP